VSPAERLAIELGAPRGDLDGRKIVPMLCGRDETGEQILAQPGWIYELKLDGVRIVADKRGQRVALGYRKGRDATDSYQEVAEAIGTIDEERVVLDGEVVAFAEDGRPDFQLLGTRIQSRGSSARRAASRVPVVYVVFDVLVIGERVVTGLPIEARKAILERIVEGATKTNGHVRLQPTLPDGKQLFSLCRERKLEGVVAKRSGSIYRADDRSSDWVKVKCELDADLVVIGWTPGEGTRSVLGALDLGAYDGDRLIVCGAVGSGLDAATIELLADRLAALAEHGPVAHGKYRPKRVRHHVRPEIVVSVRHMGLTPDGNLRHPVFRGVRDDLRPEDCTLEGAAGTATR
jgi:bifunctional non-homologous end joining protein LigD